MPSYQSCCCLSRAAKYKLQFFLWKRLCFLGKHYFIEAYGLTDPPRIICCPWFRVIIFHHRETAYFLGPYCNLRQDWDTDNAHCSKGFLTSDKGWRTEMILILNHPKLGRLWRYLLWPLLGRAPMVKWTGSNFHCTWSWLNWVVPRGQNQVGKKKLQPH